LKFGRVVYELCKRTHRRTHHNTSHPPGAEVTRDVSYCDAANE